LVLDLVRKPISTSNASVIADWLTLGPTAPYTRQRWPGGRLPGDGGRVSMRVEARLEEMGLTMPEQMQLPPGVELPFPWVRIQGNRAYISGHGPQNPDGSIAGPLGKVGADLTLAEGQKAAQLVGLSILASLKQVLGDLDRVTAWLRVFGMVNVAPGFDQMPAVINGFSNLIIELYGPEAGAHARSAVGMAGLPFGIPVEIEAEVEIDSWPGSIG
jgi:enamine deaminase RidA (YjgF/YER057c/UK114 family)